MTLRGIDGGAKRAKRWTDNLRWKDVKGSHLLEPNVSNVVEILVHHEQWRGVIALNEMAGRIFIRKPPPWRNDDEPTPRPWRDIDATRLGAWFTTSNYGCTIKTTIAQEAANVAAQVQRFHPLQDYLRSLVWDGVPRIDEWLSTYLGATSSPATRIIGPKWLISAVARAMTPGEKVDHVLVIEGAQSAGKSTAVRVLAGAGWSMDTPFAIGSKDAMQGLQGKWIVELAELESLMRSESSSAKAFFTSGTDSFRSPYGHHFEDVPRGCVFAGTVNATPLGYLKDPTGARRYWPFMAGKIDLDGLARWRDQLWAEAMERWKEGRPWWPDAPEKAILAAEAEARFQEDAWEPRIASWMTTASAKTLLEANGGWTLGDVMAGALDIEPGKWGKSEQVRTGSCLSRLHCVFSRPRVENQRGRLYRPSDYTDDDVPDSPDFPL